MFGLMQRVNQKKNNLNPVSLIIKKDAQVSPGIFFDLICQVNNDYSADQVNVPPYSEPSIVVAVFGLVSSS